LSAFARVANIKVDSNQVFPNKVKASIKHKGNVTSTVFILSIDTDFASVDPVKLIDLWLL
jgi:hypothetical protein